MSTQPLENASAAPADTDVKLGVDLVADGDTCGFGMLTCCCRTTLGGGGTAMLAMNMSMSSDLRWRSAAKEGPPGSLLSTRSGMVRLFKLVSSSSSPSQLAVLFDDAAPLYLTAP